MYGEDLLCAARIGKGHSEKGTQIIVVASLINHIETVNMHFSGSCDCDYAAHACRDVFVWNDLGPELRTLALKNSPSTDRLHVALIVTSSLRRLS